MGLNILTYSTLFPNPAQRRHGIFVETRLRHLCENFPVYADVVAPIPWFPFTAERFGLYAHYANAPRQQNRNGLNIWHPRYAVIPKLSWPVAPALLCAGSRRRVAGLHAERRYDLIDAHYFFPDGVAAVMLGRLLDVPVLITARGSDISDMPRHHLPRQQILWAARNCAAMVTVCAALRDELVALGADADKITVLRNGVDLEKFSPGARQPLRERLGVGARQMLLSVGNLIELKGNHLTIEALTELPDTVLVLVGDGPRRAALAELAREHGVADRVVFVGTVEQSELPAYYSAADALVLASSSEGWANVLLEGMACGCPAVASRVWGTPEVVAAPAAGVLMESRTPPALAAAVRRLFAHYPQRDQTRAYAEQFDWQDTSRGQYELMTQVIQRGQGKRP